MLDFGLVKTPGSAAPSLATVDGAITGTPAYMAPEMALGDDVDARADLYALGCVAYSLLTGEQVFSGDTAVKVITQHVHVTPVPPSERTELHIPAALAGLPREETGSPTTERPATRQALDAIDATAWGEEEARRWWSAHHPSQALASDAITR